MEFHPIAWADPAAVRILDQTLLPNDERYLTLETLEQVAEAIHSLRVRGAPLIGISAAMGLAALVARLGAAATRAEVERLAALLQATRPTAVNLAWALGRMRARAAAVAEGEVLVAALRGEAQAIWDEDRAMCHRIGEAGLPLLPDGATILTHCNAGALATGGVGTALAPIYLAHAAGRRIQVIADETRPLLQGSRLTAWELSRAGIPTTVIADNMAASRLRRGDVTCVIVGADRIAANGDVANKIGTYPLALAARAHAVPFYVAAPRSTFDFATPDGAAIPIEERHANEVRHPGGATRPTAPAAAAVWNPAFDVTPAALVSGYLTDAGLLDRDTLARLRD
ncbi:MAG: S-methyl-5-thioribose-1-phosphate isomerase [Gemmatimonadetes bacterium]|nr:S-methyl-5-thioribose-1-phosphate isomerase [Gemmatimonadota bacterium]MBK7714870.1 S-methyl-5-thioribose-1-phosphate isomerase [Gemmatimonadota bacterium]MBK7924867.1 S-methyl-5-thioribose-1-phosphate isomerase [Gemmatimonadota bacterium]